MEEAAHQVGRSIAAFVVQTVFRRALEVAVEVWGPIAL